MSTMIIQKFPADFYPRQHFTDAGSVNYFARRFQANDLQIIFLFNFFWSMKKGKKAEVNPWHSNTLEWTLAYPIGHGNFPEMPHVFRGPYEYSAPDCPPGMDYYPQNMPPPGWGEAKA